MARTKQTARIRGAPTKCPRKHLATKVDKRTPTIEQRSYPQLSDVLTDVERSALKCERRIALMAEKLKGTAKPDTLAREINDHLINKVFTHDNGTRRDFEKEYTALVQFVASTNKPAFRDPLPAATSSVAELLAHKHKLLSAREGSHLTFVTTKSHEQVVAESMAFGQSDSSKGPRGVSQN